MKFVRGWGLLFALLLSTPAGAQQPGGPIDGQRPAPAQPAPAEKQPPPPLFPKHRRGLYKNIEGLDVVDATPQAPPLDIDDPSVPEKGEYEINFTTRGDFSSEAKDLDLMLVDANYGLLPKFGSRELPTQLKFEVALAASKVPDESLLSGVGEANVGVKFNFYSNDHTGFSAAFYPQLEFATPGTNSVSKSLADPGQTLLLPLLVAKDLKYFTVVANAALREPIHDIERGPTATFSVGAGLALTRKLALMGEIRTESSLDSHRHRLVAVNVGLIRGIRHIVVYMRVGRSLLSDDELSHTYLGAGLSC